MVGKTFSQRAAVLKAKSKEPKNKNKTKAESFNRRDAEIAEKSKR